MRAAYVLLGAALLQYAAGAGMHDSSSRSANTRMRPCWRDDEIKDLPDYVCYQQSNPQRSMPPQNIKVYNLFDEELLIYWDNGTPEGIFSGSVAPGETHVTTSYHTHSFNYKDQSGKPYARVTVDSSQRLWAIGLGKSSSPAAKRAEKEYLALKAFADKYKKASGRFYIGPYPPQKTRHELLPADFVGQKYNVSSLQGGHWTCESQHDCDSNTPLALEVTVVSVSPKVFVIKNFLSGAEMELVRKLSQTSQVSIPVFISLCVFKTRSCV